MKWLRFGRDVDTPRRVKFTPGVDLVGLIHVWPSIDMGTRLCPLLGPDKLDLFQDG